MFSSDFPHEVNVHTVKKEIDELRENNGIKRQRQTSNSPRQRRALLSSAGNLQLAARPRL